MNGFRQYKNSSKTKKPFKYVEYVVSSNPITGNVIVRHFYDGSQTEIENLL